MASASMGIGISGAVVILISIYDVALGGLLSYFLGARLLDVLPFLLGWVAVLASIAALAGASLATTNPRVGAIIMLASAIISAPAIPIALDITGALALSLIVCFGNLLLIIAAALAFLAYRRQQSQPEPAA